MLSVIIPAFNEEKTLAQVLDRLLALPLEPQIIAVSDGSTDATSDIIRRYQRERGIVGVICAVNGGKGAAIQAGLKFATQLHTIIQDADLEYSPEQFELLLDPVKNGRATVVFGSRNLRHPAMRRNNFHYFRFWLGGKIVSMACNYLFAVHLTDEATCYKLFPTQLLRRMNLQCRGFDFCPEVTAKTLRLGHRIYEVPIVYNPRTLGEGKKIRAWHGIQAILVLAKFRLLPWRMLFKSRSSTVAQIKPALEPSMEPALAH
jgi:glycosyltransferase involved in cell wall biosynthesis